MHIKPFRAVRPAIDIASYVASYPYDIFSRNEYRKLAEREESFLHVIRSDIDLPDSISEYDERVYRAAAKRFNEMLNRETLLEDNNKCMYIYQEEMNERIQTGIVCTFPVEAYISGTVKRHELTLDKKVRDRETHMEETGVQTGAVFLAYRELAEINNFVYKLTSLNTPVNDFEFENGTIQKLWVIDKIDDIKEIVRIVSDIRSFYIIDGHHRMEAASRLAVKNLNLNQYQDMMGVIFPSSQLYNMANNRVIHTKNNMIDSEIIEKISKIYFVEKVDAPYIPNDKGCMGLYLCKQWYRLEIRDNKKQKPDAINFQDSILAPIFGIINPSIDSRFESVGSIQGTETLIEKADLSDGAAFIMYPAGMDEIMELADRGITMPPKSTWFEPKILSGLFSKKQR